MAECYKVAAFDGFNKMSYDSLCTMSCDTIAQTIEQPDEMELVSAS
jgi:hypothetical protein